MAKYQNEIEFFETQEGDYGVHDLCVKFRDQSAPEFYVNLTPEQKAVVDRIVLRMLALDFNQEESAVIIPALNKILHSRKWAPEGMSFPIGVYGQPVSDAVAHLYHEKDGSIREIVEAE